MNEMSAFDILVENLTKRGLKPETHKSENQFFFNNSNERFLHTKYIITEIDSCFFCAFDSFGAKAYTSNTYVGIYTEIGLHTFVDCRIYKKDWIDTFLRIYKVKTGVRYIDDNLTISSKSRYKPTELLSESDVKTFLEINQCINPLKIIIQKEYPYILKNLEYKLMAGLETDVWIYKENELDTFLTKGVHLIQNIKNASA